MQYPVQVPAVTVFEALRDLDLHLAEEVRRLGCPHCGGPLHRSPWQRKPRGAPLSLPESCCTRRGLCCGWCRRRTLPPSTLFCGRHVYLKAVLILVVAARQGTLAAASLGRLQQLFGVDRRTIARWMKVFWARLTASAAWGRARGRLPPGVRDADVPRGLFELLFNENPDLNGTLTRICQLVPQL